MKDKIKKWLGITKLETVIGKEKKVEDDKNQNPSSFWFIPFEWEDTSSLFGKYESLVKNEKTSLSCLDGIHFSLPSGYHDP